MKRNKISIIACIGCIIVLLSGCETKTSQDNSAARRSTDDQQSDSESTAQDHITEDDTKSTVQDYITEDDTKSTGQNYITKDEAKSIALKYANVSKDEIQHLTVEFDYDDNRAEYEVEWYIGQIEYSFDIDAVSGTVIKSSDKQHNVPKSTTQNYITKDEAKSIALKYANVSENETQHLTVEFDYDDGRAEYQVEWDIGQTEYSCEIDAVTGTVIDFEKEYD